MSRPATFFSAILVLLVAPLAYNSCQGGLLGGGSFSPSKSSCKVGLYKGELINLDDLTQPNPFQNSKVILSELSANEGLQKVSKNASVAIGSELAVIVDNACVSEARKKGQNKSLSELILNDEEGHPDLVRQAFVWRLDRDYEESELNDLANADPCVVGVSWNHTYKTQALNDPERIYQAHLPAIRSDESLNYFYNAGGGMERTTGTPVKVAVIDSGVDWQHPDLMANIWQHSFGAGIDITTLNGTINYNPLDISSVGHGTHVAGLIAAVSNNGQGVSGAMPFRAQIMPIKLFSLDASGNMTTTSRHFYNAVQFAYRNGAKVINLSLGSITMGPAVDGDALLAISEALSQGVTVVTVTGNADNGANGAEINGSTLTVIPAMYATQSGVIGVGSIDATTGLKSFFSHYSTTFGEIAAPGTDAGATGIYSTKPRNISSYGRLAGTSQAAPLVSAAAALTIGMIRDAYQVDPTPQEVERLILESAQKDPGLTGYFKNGNRLNLLNLAQKINADYPLTQSSGANSNVSTLNLSSSGCR